ncbi:unnamed protein product [Closterium sp. NIES-65]|nr:unnamed protein product [Closterium sp. NIES-65]
MHRPAGCALQRMTPKRLLTRFRNKLVLVFGDSVSKNFAGSVACVLHAASPGTIQNFRIANGNTKAYGVRVPSTNTRFASVFSNWLNQASGLGGSMNRVDLDKIDPQITDLLPLADIVVFQATNWWFPAINKWYLGGKEQSLSKEAAYEIGLKTLRDYVVKSGFKGRVALVGVSPSHYKVPGLKEGSCETSKILTAQQPWGCKVVQLTPQRLLTLFRNKTVVVFGDSVSKDLSTSLRCMLHAASPNFSRFKLAGGATRVWGEKVSDREETKMSLFSSHLNHIGFIPDASQPPSLIISFISLSPGSRPHLTTLLTRPYLSSHSHISHVQVEPQNIRIVSLFSSHLNDIGFIPDASQPPSAAAAAAGVGGATNWWYAEDNQWFLGGRQQKITRDAAYAIGLATLRDHVARSGFKGKAVVMGVSPSHYIVPVAGMKKGKCDINTRLDWNQTKEVRRMDSRSFEMRKVQLQVLKGSRLRYVDVLPMSFWRPDGHVVTLESKIVCTGVKLV